MTEAFKVCPICGARNSRNASRCATCGASIADLAPQGSPRDETSSAARYDYQLGEADLSEDALRFQGKVLSRLLILLVLLLIAGLAAFRLLPSALGGDAGLAAIGWTASPSRIAGPSVTPGTPTATYTASRIPSPTPTEIPTSAPCVQTVSAGDSLIVIVSRCGYSNLAILPTVMALNGITDETALQIGQQIIVPLPSPTPDPAATEPAQSADDTASAAARTEELVRLAFDPFAPTLTPTLLPGLMWHIVQPEENIMLIALQYKSDLKTLSDLNPEVDFPLCDFSQTFGGPECTVVLGRGQRIRVHAPTPTITPIPTASGSETPTPSPTATFNAPIAQSPPDQAFFAPLEQVTLRWVGTGALEQNDVYRIAVANTDTGEGYSADTRELFYIIPVQWQAQDANSHNYAWQISVVDLASGAVKHESQTRGFVWQGRGRAN